MGYLPTPDLIPPGHTFNGWYKHGSEEDDGVDETTPVNQDMSLYAKYTEEAKEQFRVKFFDHTGQNLFHEYNRYKGEKIQLPSYNEHTPTGYDFIGWYTSLDGGDRITPTYRVVADINLYARCKVKSCTITWNTNDAGDESEIQTWTRDYGTTLGEYIPRPARNGYELLGWFTEATDG